MGLILTQIISGLYAQQHAASNAMEASVQTELNRRKDKDGGVDQKSCGV
jgi:hypothetical protein